MSEGASFLSFSLNNGRSDSYKIVYSQMRLRLLSCETFRFFKVLSSTAYLGLSPYQSLSFSYWYRFRREGQPQLATSEDSILNCCRHSGADHSYMRMSCDLDWFGLCTYKLLTSRRQTAKRPEKSLHPVQ